MPVSIVEFEVDWSDCDPAGIVFYPQFFRMMNTGTHRLFNDAGLPFCELPARFGSFGTPLLDVQSTFRSPAKFGDRITLETAVLEWRDKTFVLEHVMKAGARIIFEAREVRVWAVHDPDAAHGLKAQTIPAQVRETLARWNKTAA